MDNQRGREVVGYGEGVSGGASGEVVGLGGVDVAEIGGQGVVVEASGRGVGEILGEAGGVMKAAEGGVSGTEGSVVKNTMKNDEAVSGDVVENNNPEIASDDGKIEKEWVGRAKEVVAKTRDDPHAREEGVKGLRADYMMKRWGRKIGDRN
jgi:hypothetical protein